MKAFTTNITHNITQQQQ